MQDFDAVRCEFGATSNLTRRPLQGQLWLASRTVEVAQHGKRSDAMPVS
jgi:hypothetical protein